MYLFYPQFSPTMPQKSLFCGINFSSILSLHLVTNPSSRTVNYKFTAKKKFGRNHLRIFFCSISHFLFSVLRLYQLTLLLSMEKKFHQITSLSDTFLSKYFSIWFLQSFFNKLKINSNSSSLMPSLLFVFEVKVDYVEGNSRMIIYNNYVEVPQLCMAKKRSFHVYWITLGQGQRQLKQRWGSKDLFM